MATLRRPPNNAEAFIQSRSFQYLVAGLLLLLSAAMLVSFFSASWLEIDTQRFTSDDEELNENLSGIRSLVQNAGDDTTISLSGYDVLSGTNDQVPTLHLDRAAAGQTGVRFVDKFMWFIPLSALLMLAISALYLSERMRRETALLLFLILSALIFLFTNLWQAFSALDWRGYEQISGIRRVTDQQPVIDVLTDTYSTNEQNLIGILMLVVSFIAWLVFHMSRQGYFSRDTYESWREDVPRYFQKKSLLDYVSVIALLALIVVVLNWFYPLAAESSGKFYNLTYQGLSDGFLLSLIALGLVLIYKATDVINFAHGELMMLGAYIFAEIVIRYDFPLSISLIVAAALMIPVGLLVERLILRPLIGEPIISVIMVTIGLSNVLGAIVGIGWQNQAANWQETGTNIENGILPLFTGVFPDDSGLKQELSTDTYQLFEVGKRIPYSFKYENVYLALVVIVFIALLIILFKYTKHGIAMRATADDQQAALSMGISVRQIFAIAWGTAALFAGVAGLLLGDIGTGANIEIPAKGLRAFPVIILGGLDSIVGAVIGGLIIGLLENYAVGYLDPWIKENVSVIVAAASTKEVISYLVLIVILMFRPYGLFGKEVIERV